MKSLYSLTRNFKTSLGNQTVDNISNYLIPKKKISIYSKDKINKYQLPKKILEYKPFPFRSFIDFSSNPNSLNYPTENEKNFPYNPNPEKSRNFLMTRQDFIKYLKKKSDLLKFKKHCISCEKLREENEKNYLSTIEQRNLPSITGRSFGNKYTIIQRFKTPVNAPRNKVSNLKYKLINFKTNRSNSGINLLNTSNSVNLKEERKNDSTVDEDSDKLNEILKPTNESVNVVSRNYNKRIFFKPKIRTNFRKTQIFNHYKPYLVDEFKDYGMYE
jgi:hypothetical protein